MYQIFDLVLAEIYMLLEETNYAIRDNHVGVNLYITRSNPYVADQIGTRLSIIEQYDFKDLPETEIHDLYQVRTLVAGIYNTFKGFGKNMEDKCFVLGEYIRYVPYIQHEIDSMKDGLKDNR